MQAWAFDLACEVRLERYYNEKADDDRVKLAETIVLATLGGGVQSQPQENERYIE